MKNAKPLLVRPDKICAALEQLKAGNFLFYDITIDYKTLRTKLAEFVAPVDIQISNIAGPHLSSCMIQHDNDTAHFSQKAINVRPPLFESVVVSDVNGRDVTSEQMSLVALDHLCNGKSFIAMKHGDTASND